MLNVQVFEQGLLGSNTILVWDDASCEGLIIDCGNHPEAIKTFAACKGVKVKYIVLSHGHYDHVDYVREYVSAFAGAMVTFQLPFIYSKEFIAVFLSYLSSEKYGDLILDVPGYGSYKMRFVSNVKKASDDFIAFLCEAEIPNEVK